MQDGHRAKSGAGTRTFQKCCIELSNDGQANQSWRRLQRSILRQLAIHRRHLLALVFQARHLCSRLEMRSPFIPFRPLFAFLFRNCEYHDHGSPVSADNLGELAKPRGDTQDDAEKAAEYLSCIDDPKAFEALADLAIKRPSAAENAMDILWTYNSDAALAQIERTCLKLPHLMCLLILYSAFKEQHKIPSSSFLHCAISSDRRLLF